MFTTYKLTAPIPIPRGGSRVRLMKTGLVRNIYIDTSWKVKDIENEITSVFGDCFDRHDGDGLPYHYLRWELKRQGWGRGGGARGRGEGRKVNLGHLGTTRHMQALFRFKTKMTGKLKRKKANRHQFYDWSSFKGELYPKMIYLTFQLDDETVKSKQLGRTKRMECLLMQPISIEVQHHTCPSKIRWPRWCCLVN